MGQIGKGTQTDQEDAYHKWSTTSSLEKEQHSLGSRLRNPRTKLATLKQTEQSFRAVSRVLMERATLEDILHGYTYHTLRSVRRSLDRTHLPQIP